MYSSRMEVSTNNRAKKFFKDFGIYSIGILGTRFITFLLVPLYTYLIDKPADYGYYDLCLNICLLFIPVVTLQMREAAFRFLLNNDDEKLKSQIITFVYKSLVISIASIAIAVVALGLFADIKYLVYSAIMLFSMAVYEVTCQIVRGVGRNDVYVSCNILTSFLVLLLSVGLIAIFDLGVVGIFLANIFSRVIVLIYIECRLHIYNKYVFIKFDTKSVSGEILRYALPLIPSTFCGTLITTGDRFFITNFVSLDMNGVYAVATRFTMILNTLVLIFYQTWQESAITQYNSKDRDAFFSKVFNMYAFTLVALLVLYSFALKLNYWWLVDTNYQKGLSYIYLLGIVALLYSLSFSYFELCYQCAKDTKRVVYGIFMSVCISFGLNIFLAPKFGVWGVICGDFVAYLILVIYRFFDTRRYVKLSVNKSTLLLVPIILLGAFLFTLDTTWMIDVLSLCGLLLILALISPVKVNQLLAKITKNG